MYEINLRAINEKDYLETGRRLRGGGGDRSFLALAAANLAEAIAFDSKLPDHQVISISEHGR
jgi:hypothetical protein